MKSLIVFLIFLSTLTQAQSVKVLKIKQLTRLNEGEYIVSGVSPDGKSVLASSPGYKGLFLINIKRKKTQNICDLQGAGYEPCWSSDGSEIYFRSDEFSNSKKYSSLLKYDLTTRNSETIESKSRELTSPVLSDDHIIYSVDGRQKMKEAKSESNKSGRDNVYVVLEDLQPVIYINSIRKQVAPGGEGNYIWVSLSPDKSMLLYNFGGTGTCICDLEGKILYDIGKLNAPKWLNNQIIVGMNDKDDGYRILSSDIISYSLVTRQKTNLTMTPDKTEMYPFPFPDGKRIVFQTLKGELYIMDLKIK